MSDKLSQLLEIEVELDGMLEATRQEAAKLVTAARADAANRIERFEAELEEANLALRDQVALGRDESVAAIRAEAKREIEKLEKLGQERVAALARYVVERLVGNTPGGRS